MLETTIYKSDLDAYWASAIGTHLVGVFCITSPQNLQPETNILRGGDIE